MRVSEAIALGMSLIDNFNPSIYLRRFANNKTCGCLMGAAMAAVGHKTADHQTTFKQWPWLFDRMFPYPEVLRKTGVDILFCQRTPEDRTGSWILTSFAVGIEEQVITLEQALDWVRENEPAEDDQGTGVSFEFEEVRLPCEPELVPSV